MNGKRQRKNKYEFGVKEKAHTVQGILAYLLPFTLIMFLKDVLSSFSLSTGKRKASSLSAVKNRLCVMDESLGHEMVEIDLASTTTYICVMGNCLAIKSHCRVPSRGGGSPILLRTDSF